MKEQYKSLTRFQGGKIRLMPFLQEHIHCSSNQQWIEPFLGGGCVLFIWESPLYNAIAGEINPHLVELYHTIIGPEDKFDLFLQEYKELASNWSEDELKDYYNKIKVDFNAGNRSAAKIMFLILGGFNGLCRFNSKGEFNVAPGNSTIRNRVHNFYMKKVAHCLEIREKALKYNWTIQCTDFSDLMSNNCNENTVCYMDPPYMTTSNDYYAGWNRDRTIELLELIKELPGEFWLSESYKENDTETILDLIPFKYEVFEQSLKYCIGGPSERTKKVTEVLIHKLK